MGVFGGDALQRKALSHKSSFIIIDSIKFDESAKIYKLFYTHIHHSFK